MSHRVLVLTEDPEGPSVRHRWRYPATSLEREGFTVEILPVEPRATRAAAFAAAGDADLVVVHRKLFRRPDLRRLLRAAPRKLLYDLDDAVMYRPSGRRRQWSLMRGLRFARTVRHARLFIAGNPYLVARAPRMVQAIVRPTPVALDSYPAKTEWPERGRSVGWIGTRATAKYLAAAGPALAALAARRDDLVLRVIGPEPPELPGVPVEHVPWSEDTEADALRSLDVGLLPLPVDRWTKGKCAFKALQYLACGVPVVASPVGMNREVVVDGVTGYLAESREEWEERLTTLLDDRELRETMGAAGRERVAEHYANEVLTPRLATTLRGLLG